MAPFENSAMSEIRYDTLRDHWTIIAAERGLRPSEFTPPRPASDTRNDACPLCPGNESRTPPEIHALRPGSSKPDGPGWEIRVVPNLFPALRPAGEARTRECGGLRSMAGVGSHELVVDSPDHDAHLGRIPFDHLAKLLGVWRNRMGILLQDPRIRYVQIFKNHGKPAGASLSHPHTQILAAPVRPPAVVREMESLQAFRRNTGGCLLCDRIGEESRSGERVIGSTVDYLAWTPYASRFPYEMIIAPWQHRPSFIDSEPGGDNELARLLGNLHRRLKETQKDPPFNLILHSVPLPPAGKPSSSDYHWHIEILPRLSTVGGLEWGTGIFINPTAPEEAARILRDPARHANP